MSPSTSAATGGEESTSSRHLAFRLVPGNDVKQCILQFAREHKIYAGAIVTCVGSLQQLNLRFANQQEASLRQGHFEIVSLVGTFSDTTAHLHLSAADKHGALLGGHLLDGNLVFTTAELVVLDLNGLQFAREKDDKSGYNELVVKKLNK